MNTLGHGLVEEPYESALCVKFALQKISFHQQSRFEVIYKSIKVGEYIPDLIVVNQIVVDANTIDKITNHEKG